ncbi:MAG: hypothetical protein GY858_02650 [Candidatus Omnitrophica bacterium]|nr:hypothetical protein [Candidatus Omnitrophota bacterium]
MKFKKSEIVGIVFLLLCILISFKFFVVPHFQALMSIRTQYTSGVRALSEREEKHQRQLLIMKKRSQKLQKEMDQISTKFLKPGQVTQFLKVISQIVKDTNNELIVLRPIAVSTADAENEAIDRIREETVRLELKSTYPSLLRLFLALNEDSKIFQIEQLGITKRNQGSGLKVLFVLKFYVDEINQGIN